MPEDYEFEFYRDFMRHVFEYSLPSFLRSIVPGDKGIGHLDPDNPLARGAFTPKSLIDARGPFVDKAGKPYVECKVSWVKANLKNPNDHGYFLYKGDGRHGEPDVCEKVGAKVAGWYFGRLLPERKVPLAAQMRKIYEDAREELAARFPGTEFRLVRYMAPETIKTAVDELVKAGCTTIVYQGINCPLYTDFEDYGHALEIVHACVAARARVVMADQLGNQGAMRAAFTDLLRDRLAQLPAGASVLVILSRHGHPFKKETQDERAPLYREPLEREVREVLAKRGGKTEVVWSFDEYGDEFWDRTRSKFETHAAYRKAIDEGWDYAVELPTEFPAENTDLMIFHAMKKFNAFKDYDRNQPVPYPDWEQPLVRCFKEGKTTGIYAGCPVGPYRKHVVEAAVNSIAQVLEAKETQGAAP